MISRIVVTDRMRFRRLRGGGVNTGQPVIIGRGMRGGGTHTHMTAFHEPRSRSHALHAYLSWKSDRRFRSEGGDGPYGKNILLIVVDFPVCMSDRD